MELNDWPCKLRIANLNPPGDSASHWGGSLPEEKSMHSTESEDLSLNLFFDSDGLSGLGQVNEFL